MQQTEKELRSLLSLEEPLQFDPLRHVAEQIQKTDHSNLVLIGFGVDWSYPCLITFQRLTSLVQTSKRSIRVYLVDQEQALFEFYSSNSEHAATKQLQMSLLGPFLLYPKSPSGLASTATTSTTSTTPSSSSFSTTTAPSVTSPQNSAEVFRKNPMLIGTPVIYLYYGGKRLSIKRRRPIKKAIAKAEQAGSRKARKTSKLDITETSNYEERMSVQEIIAQAIADDEANAEFEEEVSDCFIGTLNDDQLQLFIAETFLAINNSSMVSLPF